MAEGIANLEEILANIQEQVNSISESIQVAREMLSSLQNVRMDQASTLPETNAKLSDAAKYAIENSQGPLEPEILMKFLMEEAFGKPKPDVLPIVRRYTSSVEELLAQLNYVKDKNNQSHMVYKEEQRKLDVNLNKRIDKLVANIRKELKKEADEGRCQMSMDTFVQRDALI